MKSLTITLILLVLMLLGIGINHFHVNKTADALLDRLNDLPDVGEEGCADGVRKFCEDWERTMGTVEFSTGLTVVDRISEQAATLLACAECEDLYGYRTALALLRDAIEDMRLTEELSLRALL